VWINGDTEPSELLEPTTASLHAVMDIDYDAKGQRLLVDYGNGTRTTYTYDPLTFQLTHLLTRRNTDDYPGDIPQPPPTDWPGRHVQNLHYSYDPVGNITHIRDDAQQTIYFKNSRVDPSAEYTYDAVYRLIEATGREHLGQTGGSPIPHSYNDAQRVGNKGQGVGNGFHPLDGNAMGRYCECYEYDEVGNLVEMIHRVACPGAVSWRKSYSHTEDSQLEPGKQSNRLSSAQTGNGVAFAPEHFTYDSHGNILGMPHLQFMRWDCQDQLRMTQRQAVSPTDAEGVASQGEQTWYVYDAFGQRVRKVTERPNNGGMKNERIYLDGFEIYRQNGVNPVLRETLHIMDDEQRIASVDSRVQGTDEAPPHLTRYQLGNHLGSANLDLDEQARIISYEEYSPYGSSTYQAVPNQTHLPKRYRYSGKERDEESGLYYHGERYYAPWLARWISPDPAGVSDGVNILSFVGGNPIRFHDPTGLQKSQVVKKSRALPNNTPNPRLELSDADSKAVYQELHKEIDKMKKTLQKAEQNASAVSDKLPTLKSDISEIREVVNKLEAYVKDRKIEFIKFSGSPAGVLGSYDPNTDRIKVHLRVAENYITNEIDLAPNSENRVLITSGSMLIHEASHALDADKVDVVFQSPGSSSSGAAASGQKRKHTTFELNYLAWTEYRASKAQAQYLNLAAAAQSGANLHSDQLRNPEVYARSEAKKYIRWAMKRTPGFDPAKWSPKMKKP